MKRALAYYERHAPVRLPPPEPWPDVNVDLRASIDAAPAQASASPVPRATAGASTVTSETPLAKLSFIKHDFAPEDDALKPAVSNVRFADLDGDTRLEALGCEMRYGLIFLLRPYAPSDPIRLVSQLPAPSHIEVADVDRDGINDLLVADLGEFQPGDHLHGAAVWLRGVQNPTNPGTITFQPTIFPNLPRVADVEVADLDEDGRQDLVVAAFGWRRVGRLMWLRNVSGSVPTADAVSAPSGNAPSGNAANPALSGAKSASAEAESAQTKPAQTRPAKAKPAFEETVLDPRAGAIHVVPIDLNRDGHIDLVSVIAQEHEEVIALLNDGRGHFESKSIYAAPHPNWGSSGIQVVDLDRDGDLDVLLTHGDMFDDFLIKPYHGIQWLENRGTFPFTPHTLCSLPGVHRALAVDLDSDGDLDIVAAALMPDAPELPPPTRTAEAPAGASAVPNSTREAARAMENLPSLVWLEQTTPGVFVRHTLERGHPRHATLDAADYDRDGDIDLLVGNMTSVATTENKRPRGWVEVWENVTRRSP